MRNWTLRGAIVAILLVLCATATPAGAANFTYRGGALMPAYRTFEVVWAHSATAPEPTISDGLGEFLGDVAAASGTASNQNLFSMLPEYSLSGQVTAYDSTYLGKAQIEPSGGAQIEPPAIATTIADRIQAGALPAPVASASGAPETLYVIVLSPNMSVCIEPGSCAGPSVGSPTFCSFHDSSKYNGTPYTYAVLPDLSGNMAGGCGESVNQLDNETSSLSHQITEAVTDPLIEEEKLGWYDNSNGEIADICVTTNDEAKNTINGHTWTVQKVWSIVANSCVAGSSQFTAPTADFTATPTQGTAAFQGSGSSTNHLGSIAAGIVSYRWDFGDGQSGTGQSPSHSYAATGNYTVTMTATDSLGFTAHASHQVTVTVPTPPPSNPGGSGSTGTTGGGNPLVSPPPGTLVAQIGTTGAPATSTAGGSVLVSSGQSVQCPTGGGLCVVTIQATVDSAHAAKRHKAKSHKLVVGSATLTVSPGATAKVAFKLNGLGKRLLKAHGHLLVKLTITIRHDSDTPVVSTQTLRLAAPRKHVHK